MAFEYLQRGEIKSKCCKVSWCNKESLKYKNGRPKALSEQINNQMDHFSQNAPLRS